MPAKKQNEESTKDSESGQNKPSEEVFITGGAGRIGEPPEKPVKDNE